MSEPASIKSTGAVFDVGPTPEERANVRVLARRHALKLAILTSACWYALWLILSINVSAWVGPIVFVIAYPLAYVFASQMLRLQLADEMGRRRELMKFAMEYRNDQTPASEG